MDICHVLLSRSQATQALGSVELAALELVEHRPLTLLVLELIELQEHLSTTLFPDLPEADP